MSTFSPADLNPSFYSQFSNNSNDAFAWKMDTILESAYGSKMENIPQGDFKAKVLSGYRTNETAGAGTDEYDVRIKTIRGFMGSPDERYLEVKVRPMGIGIGKMLPDPTDPSLSPAQRRSVIGMHEWARSELPMEASLAGTLNCGDEVTCFYEYGSMRQSSFTGLRFRMSEISPSDISLMLANVQGDSSAASLFTGQVSQMGTMMMETPPPPNGIVTPPEPFVEGFKNAFRNKGYQWDTKYNIVGVRQPGGVDTFNDFVFLCRNLATGDLDEKWEVRKFTSTTKPGKSVLTNPDKYNSSGTGAAILVPGQYKDTWKIGVHGANAKKNKPGHAALKQTGGPVSLYRDNNRDEKHDYVNMIVPSDNPTKGYNGINIHRAGGGVSTRVGNWSAGCQVFASAADHKVFMGLLKAMGNKYFTYTLLINEDL